MKNILLNSLNKKILLITIFLLFVGIITQAYQERTHSNERVFVYKATERFQTSPSENISEQEKFEVLFLPLSEVAKALEEQKHQELYIDTDKNFDKKVENIEKYLSRRGAPLSKEARFMVIMANKFNLDYRLVPAISIIESSGGLRNYRKYNAWGWGGAKGFTFKSWEHSIYVVSRGMNGYYSLGLDTPEKMAPRYNPHTPNEWGRKVRMVMNHIGPAL